MPCGNCCKSLYKLGFRKLGYSNDKGVIQMMDLRYITNTHLSYAQRTSEKYCRNRLIL